MTDVTGKNPYLEELGQFLNARRGGNPDTLGRPAREAAVRRVAGLQREKVAQGAAMMVLRCGDGRWSPP